MTSPTIAPAAPPRAEAAPWRWIRELGLVRDGGWAGGVCAAIAHRIGVDPIVVRGVFAVATVLGFPGLWLYAACWALLPDAQGRIALQLRGGSAPAILGALATAGLAIVSTVGAGLVFGTWAITTASFLGLGGAMASGVVALALAAVVIVWLARRQPLVTSLPATGDAGGASTATAAGDGVAVGAAPSPLLTEPIAPEPSGDMDAWRAQYAEWRVQHDAWRRQQVDGERAAREEERARRREQVRAFRAEAARLRAERRAAKPRTSIAFVAVTAGLALIVAVGTWMAFQVEAPERAAVGAVLAAAATVAIAMIVAGLMRRRSGFLAFVAVVLLAIGGSGVVLQTFDEFVPPGSAYRVPPAGDYEIAQAFGDLTLDVGPWEEGEGVTRVVKGSGTTWITVQPGVDVRIEIAAFGGSVQVNDWSDAGPTSEAVAPDPDGSWSLTYDGGTNVPARTILLDQRSGQIIIDQFLGGSR